MGAGGGDRRRRAGGRDSILDRPPQPARNPRYLADVELPAGDRAERGVFHRWGLLAVFFARFVPPIRAFVPITAGAFDMPPLRFYPVNFLAILLWAPEHVLPGVLAVTVLDRYGKLIGLGTAAKHYWMPLVVGVALIVASTIWIIRRWHGGNAIEPAPRPLFTRPGTRPRNVKRR